MQIATTREELRALRDAAAGQVAVVMTMGALHDGHIQLARHARTLAPTVLMTIFVNPLQFGPTEDLDRYPRTLEQDLALAEAAGIDLVFTPTAEVMYPHGRPVIGIDPGPIGTILEGASRPDFFPGMLVVVHKLLELTRPDFACFGEKDYQQLIAIRTMVRDLDLPVRIVPVPTVREPDGLALSSRNRYLAPAERAHALTLHRALDAASSAAGAGADPLMAARATLAAVPAVKVDYLALTGPDLGPPPERGAARLLVAAWVGGTRLIDNIGLELR